MAFRRFVEFQVQVEARASSPTLPQNSVEHDGVTFTFDREIPVGQFATGEPFVVSSQPFAVTSITPVSAVLNGAVANGAMKDPYLGDGSQGFDAFLAGDIDTGSGIAYANDRNVDPAIAGNINIALGEETTIVKSVRVANVTNDQAWQTIEKYCPLTVLSKAPPDGCFMPTWSGSTKRIYTISDVDTSVFRSLPITATGASSPLSLLADLPKFMGLFGSGFQQARRLRLDVRAGHGLSANNYSAAINPAYARACLIMHSNAFSDVQKQALLHRLLTWGIQVEGLLDRGWNGGGRYRSGAGQVFGFTAFSYLAAFALKSETMLAKISAMQQPFDQVRWLTASRLNTVPGTKSGSRGVIFMDEQLDIPYHAPDSDVGGQFESRYGHIAANGIVWEAASTVLLQNGPSGATGFSARNAGNFGTENDRSAVWAFCDRAITLTPWMANSYDINSAKIAWLDARTAGVYTPWSGVPDGLFQGSGGAFRGENGDFFTAVTGGFTWNLSAFDYATEAKTGAAFRYSLDGTQWIEDTAVADNDGITGLLPGVTHHLGFRWRSASGWGPWVPNYRTQQTSITSSDPNILTTLGGSTATVPNFTIFPEIHKRLRSFFGDRPGNWLPVNGTLGANEIRLKCGLGYVDGGVEPSFAFQWKRNGASILGATSQTYARTAADAGAVLSCEVTPSNEAGAGALFETEGVTCPPLEMLPADTLIDTDFRGAFAINYEEAVSTLTGSGYTVSHTPNAYPIDKGENFGALKLKKTAGNPIGGFNVSVPALPATTYGVSAEIAVDGDAFTNRGDFRFFIFDGSSIEVFRETLAASTFSGGSKRYLWSIADSFSSGTGGLLKIRIQWANGTGGAGGGTPYLTRLRILQE